MSTNAKLKIQKKDFAGINKNKDKLSVPVNLIPRYSQISKLNNLPLSLSTSIHSEKDKKIKSVLAHREAEYDKNLKRIKFNVSCAKSISELNTVVKVKHPEKENVNFYNRLNKFKFVNSLHERRYNNNNRERSRSMISNKERKAKIEVKTSPYMVEAEDSLNSTHSKQEFNYVDEKIEKELPIELEIALLSSSSSAANISITNPNKTVNNILDQSIPEAEDEELILGMCEMSQDIIMDTHTIYTGLPAINLCPLNLVQENINKINLGFFTCNYENLKMNKESNAKFSREEYRRVLSTFLRFEYGKSILDDFFNEEEVNNNFLATHELTERMRMRMVDWMIEVLSNYKCDDNTFFLAVNIMDRYFKFTNGLKPEDLHLVGICSMFLASKFYDIHPIKLQLVIEKIGHSKFSKDEIVLMEENIIKSLNYEILKPTSFDFVNLYFEEIFFFIENNFMVADETLSDYFKHFFSKCEVDIKFGINFYYEKHKNSKKFSNSLLNLLRKVIVYLSKMNCHDYSLIGMSPSLIAASSIFVAMKICEQINNEEYINEYFIDKLCKLSRYNEYNVLFYAQKILFNAQNFEKCFHGLCNLKKVHFDFNL